MSNNPPDQTSIGGEKKEIVPNVKVNLWRSFLKSLILPICVLAVFLAAPHWLNNSLRPAILSSIEGSTKLSPSEKAENIEVFSKLDFSKVALGKEPGFEMVQSWMEHAGVAGQFRRLHWGLLLSMVLVGLLIASSGIMLLLNQFAKQSQDNLIRCYRVSWSIGMVTTVIKLFLLIPLMTYGSFELMVLLTEHYWPKLLILIIILGLTALWQSIKILLHKVPLEFEEAMSREVTPEEAPELWQAVRDAAARLQTAPPDRILIGLQLNFYVTELAVRHGSGKTQGRTLYLSYPLLKQLSEQEVLAVIGHELGHFIGEDTKLSREFFPMRLKADATMAMLAHSSWMGWTSLQFLTFFHWCFEGTERAMSRKRELLADQKSAVLTSPQTAAHALLKFHAVSEAFEHTFAEAMRNGGKSLFDLPLQAVIREKLPVGAKFWSELFEKKSPHPLDTHPALHVRLEALGQNISAVEAHNVATTEIESAFSKWFAHREELFTAMTKEAEAKVEEMRSKVQVVEADYTTEEGKQLLEQHFPEKKWHGSKRRFWGISVFLAALIIGCIAAAVAIHESIATYVIGGIMIILGLIGTVNWKRHKDGELVLKADGINYSGWKRPLKFEDARNISAQNNNGILTITFRLEKPQEPIWKFTLFGNQRKSVSISVNGFNEKPAVIAQTMYQYFTRQVKDKEMAQAGH